MVAEYQRNLVSTVFVDVLPYFVNKIGQHSVCIFIYVSRRRYLNICLLTMTFFFFCHGIVLEKSVLHTAKSNCVMKRLSRIQTFVLFQKVLLSFRFQSLSNYHFQFSQQPFLSLHFERGALKYKVCRIESLLKSRNCCTY